MDIKRLSPQNLFLRFVATFLVVLAVNIGEASGNHKTLELLFLFSLTEVFIFSILMMLFYLIMVQYLMKKSELQLAQALICRYAHWLVNLMCLELMQMVFQWHWTLAEAIILWLLCEIAVYLAEKLFDPKRGNDDGR